jgi:hypothetical protein
MKMTSIWTVGLIMVGATYASAQTDKPSIDTPVSTVHMDQQGTIREITFENGSTLKNPNDASQGRVIEILGVRRLPVEMLEFSIRGGGTHYCFSPCSFGPCCRITDQITAIHLNPQASVVRPTQPSANVMRTENILPDNFDKFKPRSYFLIEFRDRNSGEKMLGTLEP